MWFKSHKQSSYYKKKNTFKTNFLNKTLFFRIDDTSFSAKRRNKQETMKIETIDIVDSSAKAGNERGIQIKLAGSDITIRSNARAIEISSSTDKLTATPADADKGTFGYDFSKKPSKTKLFLKVLLTFILTYSSIFLSLFLTSGTSYGQVIMFDLNGFYLVLLLLVFSLLISLFSFILEFLPFSKSSLSDYFLSFKIKDETLVEENESRR